MSHSGEATARWVRPETYEVVPGDGADGLRKTFDGLSALVQGSFGMSATSGDLFIFLNRRGTQVRILFWDRGGFCVLMKKLEAGTFRRVKTAEGIARVEIDAGELAMLLEGIDAPKVRRRKRYVLRENESRHAGAHDPSC